MLYSSFGLKGEECVTIISYLDQTGKSLHHFCYTVLGADPTSENELGHRPSEYVRSQQVKDLITEGENKVRASSMTRPLNIGNHHL